VREDKTTLLPQEWDNLDGLVKARLIAEWEIEREVETVEKWRKSMRGR
jgi:hypothetical protein